MERCKGESLDPRLILCMVYNKVLQTQSCQSPHQAAGITPLLYRCEDRALESEPTPVSAAGRDRTRASGPILFTDVWTVQLAMKQAYDFPSILEAEGSPRPLNTDKVKRNYSFNLPSTSLWLFLCFIQKVL